MSPGAGRCAPKNMRERIPLYGHVAARVKVERGTRAAMRPLAAAAYYRNRRIHYLAVAHILKSHAGRGMVTIDMLHLKKSGGSANLDTNARTTGIDRPVTQHERIGGGSGRLRIGDAIRGRELLVTADDDGRMRRCNSGRHPKGQNPRRPPCDPCRLRHVHNAPFSQARRTLKDEINVSNHDQHSDRNSSGNRSAGASGVMTVDMDGAAFHH